MKINLRKQTHFFIVLFVLCVFLASPQIAQASGNQDHPFPSLKSFTDQVRHSGPGPQGIWAEGLFAFEVKTDCWGCVPNQRNLASYSTLRDYYHGFFIHSYLGGSVLYATPTGTKIAVIYADSIQWYETNGGAWFQTQPNSETCGYSGAGPFWFWGGDTENTLSVEEILASYYTMDKLAIQTSVCTADGVGLMVLNASWIPEPEKINYSQLYSYLHLATSKIQGLRSF